MPNVLRVLNSIAFINLGLLIFNLLPIYPLDGGQILRSLLGFLIGRAWSLTVVAVLGFVGVAGMVLLAIVRPVISASSGMSPAFVIFSILTSSWGRVPRAYVTRGNSSPGWDRRHARLCADKQGSFQTRIVFLLGRPIKG